MICKFCDKLVTKEDFDNHVVIKVTDPNRQPPEVTLHHKNCGKPVLIYWGNTQYQYFLSTDKHGNKYLFADSNEDMHGSYGLLLTYPGRKYKVVEKPHDRIKHLAGKEVNIVHWYTGLCITADLIGIYFRDLEYPNEQYK